jgi:hypothetical protein
MRISPPGVVFPMAATIGQDLRKSQATFDPLDQGIVGFLEEHSFKPVATLSTVGSVERTAMNLSAGNPPDYTALWGDKANIGTTLAKTVHTATQAFNSGLDTEAAVILPRLLPLSSPCIIPPGIIGTVSSINTVDKLRDILRYFSSTWGSWFPVDVGQQSPSS